MIFNSVNLNRQEHVSFPSNYVKETHSDMSDGGGDWVRLEVKKDGHFLEVQNWDKLYIYLKSKGGR